MKMILFILAFFVLQPYNLHIPSGHQQSNCIGKVEKNLYDLLMAYRKQKKLPLIPLSSSLCYVAQTHARDLSENQSDTNVCNQHSWSDKGKWTSCCYYADHRNKECMWNKPKELTNYNAPGFEIAYYSSAGVVAEQALAAWKKSPGHNAVIVNTGIWKGQKWNAIGIGIYKNYATVWFGMEPDKEGIPAKCQ
jgi:uncharacterized protein YkwD